MFEPRKGFFWIIGILTLGLVLVASDAAQAKIDFSLNTNAFRLSAEQIQKQKAGFKFISERKVFPPEADSSLAEAKLGLSADLSAAVLAKAGDLAKAGLRIAGAIISSIYQINRPFQTNNQNLALIKPIDLEIRDAAQSVIDFFKKLPEPIIKKSSPPPEIVKPKPKPLDAVQGEPTGSPSEQKQEAVQVAPAASDAAPVVTKKEPPPNAAEPRVTERVIERIAERVIDNSQFAASNAALAALQAAINNLQQSTNQQIQNVHQVIAQSSNITSLSSRGNTPLTIANPTFSGTVQGLEDADIPDNITVSNYLPLSGGTISGIIGIGTSTPGAALGIKGAGLFEGDLTFSFLRATSTAATSTFDGGVILARSAGNVGVGTSSPQAQLAVAEQLLVGGTSTSTFQGNVHVWGSLGIGKGSAFISDTALETTGSFTLTTASDQSNLVLQSLGRVGVSSTTPWGVLSVEHNGADQDMPVLVVGDQGTSSPYIYVEGGYGRVGFGTTSPYGQISIEITGDPNNPFNEGLPALVVSSRGTSTPSFFIDGGSGRVGIGTSSPANLFSVGGDTLLAGALTVTGAIDLQGSCAGCVTPAGSTGQVQFNNAGLLAGNSNLLFESNNLAVGGDLSVSGGDFNLGTGSATTTLTSSAGILGLASTTLGTGKLEVGGGGLFKGNLFVEATTTVGALNATTTLSAASSSPSGVQLAVQGRAIIGDNLNVSGLIDVQSTASSTIGALVVDNDFQANDIFASGKLSSLDRLEVTGGATSTLQALQTANAALNSLRVTGNALFDIALEVAESATSSFTGGVNVITSGGLSSASGITLTGGDLLLSAGKVTVSGSATNTLPALSVNTLNAGLDSQFQGKITVTSTATSTIPSLSATNINTTGLNVGGALRVDTAGTSTFSGPVSASQLNATGVTTGDILSSGKITVSGSATSTLPNLNVATLLQASYLNLTGRLDSSSTATSTFSGGLSAANLNMTGGLSVGADSLLSGKLTISSAATSTIPNLNVSTLLGAAAINTSGPLSAAGKLEITGTATSSIAGGLSAGLINTTGLISSGRLDVSSTATSSFSGGMAAPALSLSTGGLAITGGDLLSSGLIKVSGTGTSTLSGGLAVSGAVNTNDLQVADQASFTGRLEVLGSATSSLAGGLQAQVIHITSSTATSTFANGIELTGSGCFRMPDGTCLKSGGGGGGGSGTVNSGTAGYFAYYPSTGTTVDDVTSLLFYSDNARIGLGTSTPYAQFSIEADNTDIAGVGSSTPIFAIGDSGTSTPSIYVDGGYGRVGFGTSSPYGQVAIEVVGEPNNNSNENLPAFVIGSRGTTTPIFVVNSSDGRAGFGTATPWGRLSVEIPDVSDERSAAFVVGDLGTSTPALAVYSSGITTIDQLQTGALSFDTNAGAVAWIDMPVTSSAVWGTIESYTAQIDATSTLTVYAESDGKGGVFRERVGVATTSPGGTLAIHSGTSTPALLIYQGEDTGEALRIQAGDQTAALMVRGTGAVGIGTTSPGTKLDVAGFGLFKGNLTVEGNLKTSNLLATSTASGFGTSSPYTTLSVEIPADTKLPAFVVQDAGTSTPALAVYPSGFVSVGTTTAAANAVLDVTGAAGTSGTTAFPAPTVLRVLGGAGGASTGGSGAKGANILIVSGRGGFGGETTGDGGNAGTITIKGGDGGAGASAGMGGRGGDILLIPGSAGTGGTAGQSGSVGIGATTSVGSLLAVAGNALITGTTTVQEIKFMEYDIASSTPNRNTLYANNIVKGWINIEGNQAIAAIRNSFNVSSLTDNTTGDYTITWAQGFKTATYAVAGIATRSTGVNDGYVQVQNEEGMTATSLRVEITNSAGSTWDPPIVTIIAIGDQ
jgi:hypothetical protein